MGKNYIIGGGLAGLIMLELTPYYYMLTNNVGGQMNSEIQYGPRILQYSPKVASFLRDINIRTEPKEFKVGYLTSTGVTFEITKSQRELYYKKTRGNTNINGSCMSEGKTSIIGWDINEINLVKILHTRNLDRILIAKVNKIDTKNKVIDRGCPYDNLISTIDLQYLLQALDINYQLEKRMVYFTKVKINFVDELDIDNLDYIYDLMRPYITRITKTSPTERVIESTMPIKSLPCFTIISSIKASTQIVEEIKAEEINGIKLVGRYAQYDHGIKANNIIDKYYEGVTYGKERNLHI